MTPDTILAINASHRGEKGITALLLEKMRLGAEETGAEWETLHLSQLKINRCLSCYHCQKGEKRLTCVYNQKDDARLVFDKLSSASLVIYATPIYLMTMSGLMKNLLDRMYSTMDVSEARLTGGLIHHHIDPSISSKPFLPLIVCGNLETSSWKNAADYFRIYARFMEAPQVGLLVRNASQLFDVEGNSRLLRRFPKVREVFSAYHQAGRELADKGRIGWWTQRRANQEVIPFPFFSVLKHIRPIKRQVIAVLNTPSYFTDNEDNNK
jgi:NAD(P)H-dependent FMN reductase